ncbi:hypothetical protein [Kineococcus sp. SYSU DK003]|uniref:hypothetical protein n=1 Tax=Kineococcus sp. SYSU DK003 TaxID=3383124 RepID=UPI003D7C9EA9
MVQQKRDQAAAFLQQALARGNEEEIAFGRLWLAERQQTGAEAERIYDIRL